MAERKRGNARDVQSQAESGTLTHTPRTPVITTPRIVDWVDVEEYPGFKARVWVNFPQKVLTTAQESDDLAERKAALRQIVLEHNGWGDFDGNPYPAADDTESDPDFWDAVPLHLAVSLMRAVRNRATRSPLATKTARS